MKYRCYLIHRKRLRNLKQVKSILELARVCKQRGNLEGYGRLNELAKLHREFFNY